MIAGLAASAGFAWAADDFVCFWGNNASGNWSDTNPTNTGGKTPGWWNQDGVAGADIADDLDLLDGVDVVARFAPMTGSTVTLDSNRTVSRVWYNWDGSTGATASGSLTIGTSGGNVLTLARQGGTPEIHIGYRYTSGNSTIGMTINAPLAGTQGFTVGSPATEAYGGFGLVLGGANTISGTISGFRLLTLRNALAAQNARLSISGTFALRLRHNTDGTTFPTAGITLNTSSTSGGATINVDRVGIEGGTDHRLVLEGPITVGGQDRVKTLSVTGANGYRLELAGCYTNTFASATSGIRADSANVTLTGANHNLGGGLVLGGLLATGINAITGSIDGTGGVVKTNAATWSLSGTNTYSGTTTVWDGMLLVDGGSIGTTSTTGDSVTVKAGGTLGGDGGTLFANVTIEADGCLSAGTIDALGSLAGTLTIGSTLQTASVSLGSGAVLAVDVASAEADRIVVHGTVALGASSGDAVNLAVRELGPPTAGAYKIMEATGGITLPGTLAVIGDTELTRIERREDNTQLWLLPPPLACTLIQLR